LASQPVLTNHFLVINRIRQLPKPHGQGIISLMRLIGSTLRLFFGLMVLVAVYTDLTDGRAGFTDVGYLWFELAPSSLQISEAIISRYIDPCGLFISLDCAPFLWPPVISFFLLLPAAPFFIGVTALLILWRKYREGRGQNSGKPNGNRTGKNRAGRHKPSKGYPASPASIDDTRD
jgi:hypothetical protein